VRDFLTEYAKSMNQDPQTVEEFCDALEKDWYFLVDGALTLISNEKWKEYRVPDRLVQAMKVTAEYVKDQMTLMEKEQESLTPTRLVTPFRLSDSFSKETTVETLHNLVVTDKLENLTVEQKEPKEESKMNSCVAEVANVINAVASRLETKEDAARIANGLDNLLKQEKLGDMELELEELFHKVIGVDSKTARIFKAVNQNIIFIAIFQLKSKVPMTTMTRDVREKNGWRIFITFAASNTVAVTHRRREQSLATASPDEKYWFEWELRLHFDKEISDLQSSILRITDLGFDQNANPRKKETISKQLSHGNLIVS